MENTSYSLEDTSEASAYGGGQLLRWVWSQPRRVMAYLAEYEPTKYVAVLLLLHGVVETFLRAMDKHGGDKFSLTTIIVIALLLGPLGGLLSGYLFSFLLTFSGQWLGGRASVEQVRLVLAWATVPALLLLVVFPLEWIFFGVEPFASQQPRMEAAPWLSGSLEFLTAVLAGWTVFISLVGLSQVQGFSVWKALLNCLLAGLTLAVPILALVLLYKLLT